jgi:glycosyltransferase involved in cell wall biosynthesis
MHHALEVFHPRYPLLPRIGMSTAPFLLAMACAPTLRGLVERGYGFDVIDAHYFYPNGVAAVLLGRRFGKPVVVTARGSDVTLIPAHTVPRRLIIWAARQAAAIITVSGALGRSLEKLGVDASKVSVLRNGVDLEAFRPLDRETERSRLGINGPLLLSVGHLIERKGHDLVIRSLTSLVDATLLVIGEGPERSRLELLAREIGVAPRVRFVGAIAQAELPRYYSAADALVLASSREGWPNVLLEAMACGAPVIAARVGGIPEIVTSAAAGALFEPRTVEALVSATRQLLASPPAREDTRRHAERFSWEETTRGQLALFRRIVGSRGDPGRRPPGSEERPAADRGAGRLC